MGASLLPLQFLLLALAAWLSRQQQEVTDYLKEENRFLKEKLGPERFVHSIKEECLNRMIFFGEVSLRRAVCEYVAHYHAERNHQGLGNKLIAGNEENFLGNEPIRRRARLGGLLSYYYREAA